MSFKQLINFFALGLILVFATNICGQSKKIAQSARYTVPDKIIRLPDIPYYDSKGEKLYFEKDEGSKLLVTFWATWCAPCAKKISELDILKRDFKKIPIKIIAISEDYQDLGSIESFYKQNNIRSLEIYKDRGNEIFRELAITSLPISFFVDEDGIIKLIIEGNINWNSEDTRKIILDFVGQDFILPKNTSQKTSLNTIAPNTNILTSTPKDLEEPKKQAPESEKSYRDEPASGASNKQNNTTQSPPDLNNNNKDK
ncbi:MAG: TlpA disulfide reductase family protein [Rickettsiaceae bacterium]|nr:TlpA disulfide reductase family protein [Rickettsiaceae bacterium]